MGANAQREMRASLRLNRAQEDARNMLRVIFAQEGKTTCASRLWHEMVRDLPDYEPARANLAILGGQSELAAGVTAAAPSSAASIVKASRDERDKHLPPGRSTDQSDNRGGGSNIH